jgi:ATPase subunit of ABC transporter with duplicated ATPase domains
MSLAAILLDDADPSAVVVLSEMLDTDAPDDAVSFAVDGGLISERKVPALRELLATRTRDRASRAGDAVAIAELAAEHAATSIDSWSQPSRFRQDAVTSYSREILIKGLIIGAGLPGRPPLLENAELRLHPGTCHALIGRNGSGKTTLLKAIHSRKLDGIPSLLRIVFIEQDSVSRYDEETPVQVVMRETNKTETELALVRRTLLRLGVPKDSLDKPAGILSGGQRMRVMLATALIDPPELLLADEITNFLDIPSIAWCAARLREIAEGPRQTCVLFTSHDRAFLNQVSDEIIEIDSKKRVLAYWPGDFEAYVENKSEKRRKQQRAYEAQEIKREKITQAITTLKQQAYKSGDDKRLNLAASRQKKMERFGAEKNASGFRWRTNTRRKDGWIDGSRVEVEAPDEEDEFEGSAKFVIPAAAAPAHKGPILQLEEVTFAYNQGGPNVIERLTLEVTMKSRLAVIGGNGVGKTTLLSLLKGQLHPTGGHINRWGGLKISMLGQHHELPGGTVTPIGHLLSLSPGLSEGEARGHLAKVGLGPQQAVTPIARLSGGERTKVIFAALTISAPHILILDEPTSHLDIGTIASLVRALRKFEGGVVVVAHDADFVSQVADDILLLERKKGAMVATKLDEDGFNEYLERVSESVV